MNQHQTDSMHAAEQTPATQPADEAVAALTDEELEQVAGGDRLSIDNTCSDCGVRRTRKLPCPNPNCPSN